MAKQESVPKTPRNEPSIMEESAVTLDLVENNGEMEPTSEIQQQEEEAQTRSLEVQSARKDAVVDVLNESTEVDDSEPSFVGGIQTKPGQFDKTAESLFIFRPKLTMEAEMENLKTMRDNHPEYAAQILLQGESLVEMASEGTLEPLVEVVLACREGELMTWTVTRMFKAACLNGKESVIRFMLKNGINKRQPGLTFLLHDLVEEAENEKILITILPILIREGEFDVNSMRRPDGLTPLHLACSKLLVHTFKLLVLLGADIHAIANDNSMPINCALLAGEQATTTNQVVNSGDIVKFLKHLGAQETITYLSYSG